MNMITPRSIYVAFDVFPRPKGSSSHIAAMVRAMAGQYGPVLLLCLGHGEMPGLQIEQDGDIVIRRFKMYHPNLLQRAVEFGDFVRSQVEQAGGGLELVVFRDPWSGAPALAAEPDCAVIFEVNALPSWELGYTYPAFRDRHALRAKIEDMERSCLLGSDLILTVSSVTRDALIDLDVDPDRIRVRANSAAEAFLHADGADCSINGLEQGRWFGYVGSLHPWQGVNTLIDAFGMAAPDHPDAHLLIVTNGRKQALKTLKKRIRKRRLEDRVLVHGPLSPPSLASAMARMRFTTAPLSETPRNTRQGCCPVKIVESMAAGAPVLASDLRVCRELIRHRKDGLLAPPDDSRAWAFALSEFLGDDGLAARLGRSARERAHRSFAWSTVRATLEADFKEAVQRYGSAPHLVA